MGLLLLFFHSKSVMRNVKKFQGEMPFFCLSSHTIDRELQCNNRQVRKLTSCCPTMGVHGFVVLGKGRGSVKCLIFPEQI